MFQNFALQNIKTFVPTVPEIVQIIVNRIIKICFNIIEGGGEDNQMFIISEKANVSFSRFLYFKVNFCSELQ